MKGNNNLGRYSFCRWKRSEISVNLGSVLFIFLLCGQLKYLMILTHQRSQELFTLWFVLLILKK